MRCSLCIVLFALGLVFGPLARPAAAQSLGPTAQEAQFATEAKRASYQRASGLNPLQALTDAGGVITGGARLGSNLNPSGLSGAPAGGVSPDGPGLSVAINIMLLLTVVALVPSIMLMCTSFVRILIVLALLRQAIGTQSLPPSQVITGLALFMTAMVMKPTIDRIWSEAVVPYQNGEIRDVDVLWKQSVQPVRDFMFDQIEATGNWKSVYTILNYQGVDTSEPENLTRADVATTTLIPAYMLSELKTAFLMGFRVYLPFLVIDMVIASLLISMSMMMLPPVLISLPFKLMLFVLVDGWTLVVGSLLESFVIEGHSSRSSAVGAMVLLVAWRVVRPDRPETNPPDIRTPLCLPAGRTNPEETQS